MLFDCCTDFVNLIIQNLNPFLGRFGSEGEVSEQKKKREKKNYSEFGYFFNRPGKIEYDQSLVSFVPFLITCSNVHVHRTDISTCHKLRVKL